MPRLLAPLLAAVLCLLACDVRGPRTADGGGDAGVPDGGVDAGLLFGVDRVDGGVELSVATWNLEWFGQDGGYGPTDEGLQYANVRGVIADAGFELLAVEEVVDAAWFHQLVSELGPYSAMIASDWDVWLGADYYTPWEQKVGLVYRSDLIQVHSATVLLVEHQYAFGYRPPIQYELTVSKDGFTVDLVVIVLHMKAYAGTEDRNRRDEAARVLKDYLDGALGDREVLVLGDWNDDIDRSISQGATSPYARFVEDPARYTFLTSPLTAKGTSTTVNTSYQPIDHQLATDEARARYIRGSVQVVRPDLWPVPVSRYGSTTSDHYPVETRLQLGVRE